MTTENAPPERPKTPLSAEASAARTSETLPPTSTNRVAERRFEQRKMLIVFCALSLGVHVGLVAGWVLFPGFSKPAVDLDEAVVKTRLVKLGKPRDEKLLPRIPTAPAPPKDDPKSKPSDEPKPENQKPDSSKQPSAADILKDFKEKQAESKDINDILKRVGEQTDEGKEDGDKDGDSLTGEIQATYYARVGAHIRKFLEISATLSDEERIRLRAELALKIGEGGELVDVRIQTSSGSAVFDNDVLAAAKRSAPLPAPPPQVRDKVAKGIAFNVTPLPSR